MRQQWAAAAQAQAQREKEEEEQLVVNAVGAAVSVLRMADDDDAGDDDGGDGGGFMRRPRTFSSSPKSTVVGAPAPAGAVVEGEGPSSFGASLRGRAPGEYCVQLTCICAYDSVLATASSMSSAIRLTHIHVQHMHCTLFRRLLELALGRAAVRRRQDRVDGW